jgi:hypothetical protein
MKKTTQPWQRRAGQLVRLLKLDLHNGLMLKDRWGRSAHSMVNGWRIRLSRPPAKGNVKVAQRTTWKEFALRGTGILSTKKIRAKKSDWHLWATRRMTGGTRYIPKRKRSW